MDKKVRLNFIYSSFYQILTILIPLVTTPYLSRILGPTRIGEYSYAYSIASYFVMFIMLGLNNYGNRTIAAVKDDRERLSKNFYSIFTMQISIASIIVVVYLLYAILLSPNVMTWIMGIYVISAVLDINWFFFGMELFKLTVTRNTIVKLLTTVSVFMIVKKESDIHIYAIIMVLGILLSQVLVWPFVSKYVDKTKIDMSDVLQHVKPNIILFVPVIAISLYKVMDKIMLGFLSNMTEVGLYESSEKVITIPMSLVSALGTVMLPKMSHLVANKNKEESKKYIKSSLILAMFLSTSLCFGIMGIAKSFVPIFYGNGYQKCIILFQILLPSCLFLAFANVVRTQYLLPNNLDMVFIKSSFLGAIVNIIINFILIPQWQSVGAAIGTLFAEASVCVYQAIVIRKEISIVKYFLNTLPFIFAGVVMWSVLMYIDLQINNSYLQLGVLVLLGIVIYFVIILAIFIFKKIIMEKRKNEKTI